MNIKWSLLIFFAFAFIFRVAFAQDDELPDYLRKAQNAVNKVTEKVSGTKQFTDDVLAAQNYLKLAETEYRKNLGWTGALKQEAIPNVRHYSNMAELTSMIVLSKLEKIRLDNERNQLENSIEVVRSRIKVFDNKNLEISKLKSEIASLNASILQKGVEASELSKKVAALSGDLNSLRKEIENLDVENKRLKADIESMKGQTTKDIHQLQTKLTLAEKDRALLEEISKTVALSKVSSDSFSMIIPRRLLIKQGSKGVVLAPNADMILESIAKIMKEFAEYKVSIKVYGFGTPAKQEDVKATGLMAKAIKDYFVDKAKINPESIEATGIGSSQPLFSKEMAEMNKRVEILFKKP